MKKGERGFTMGELMIVAAIVFLMGIPVGIASIWVGGSVLTSGIKAVSNNCGQTYQVESLFSGDWFCPEEVE